MARTGFQRELELLRQDVIKIGQVTKDCVRLAVLSLQRQDLALAEQVYQTEEVSDVLNLEVEERALRISALQQPVAKDLRFIASMMKISDNFERICDLAAKIADITKKTTGRPLLKPLVDIPNMAEVIVEIIDIVLDKIETNTSVDEKLLTAKDDIIDGHYKRVHNELIDFMIKDPKTIDDATDLLFAARHLERMGDLAIKCGSRIIYMLEGRRVWIE